MRRLVSTLIITLFMSGVMIAAGCKGTSQEAPTVPVGQQTEAGTGLPKTPNIELDIKDFAYSQKSITVTVGTTVIWKNLDSVSHTVTSKDVLFDSGRISPGDTFSYTFKGKGSYGYYCTIHTYMTGEVIVE